MLRCRAQCFTPMISVCSFNFCSIRSQFIDIVFFQLSFSP